MPGLDPGIHVLVSMHVRKTWMAGHRRAEATPSFGRLCPAMTKKPRRCFASPGKPCRPCPALCVALQLTAPPIIVVISQPQQQAPGQESHDQGIPDKKRRNARLRRRLAE